MVKRKLLGILTMVVAAVAGLASPAAAAADGPYVIANWGIQGRCVDLPGYGPGTVDGPVNEYTCDNSTNDNQQWYFVKRGTDTDGQPLWWIMNRKDNLCLDLPDYGPVPPATKVTQYTCSDDDNQYWRTELKFQMYKRNWYWIRNVKSGLCLDIPGVKDAPVDVQLEVYPCRSNDDHEWYVGDWW